MRISTGLRGLRAVGAMMLLGVWALNPSLYFLKSLLGQHDGMSAIAANAIQAPQQKKEICHHHPQGCPKDCFCPKILPDEGGATDISDEISDKRESIHQPILVQCTEDNAAAGPPAGVTALANPVREIRMPFWVVGRCPNPLIPSLLEAPQEPPLKIPIA